MQKCEKTITSLILFIGYFFYSASCLECYYVGIQTWGACVTYINNPSYGEAIKSSVPPCNVSDLDGTNVGTNESNATGCLTGDFTFSAAGIKIRVLVRGYVPYNNPMYPVIGTLIPASYGSLNKTTPSTFISCAQFCQWLRANSLSYTLNYFRCNDSELTNGENLTGINYSNSFFPCSTYPGYSTTIKTTTTVKTTSQTTETINMPITTESSQMTTIPTTVATQSMSSKTTQNTTMPMTETTATSGIICYYAGTTTYGSCLVSISNPIYAGFIAATVPACTTADYAGTTTGSETSTATDCLTTQFTISLMGITVTALMRGYIPVSNPLYSFATMFGVSMPATFTDCQSMCNWLLSYAGSTGLQYFRCYNYGLSNGEDMTGASYTSNYQSCSSYPLSQLVVSPATITIPSTKTITKEMCLMDTVIDQLIDSAQKSGLIAIETRQAQMIMSFQDTLDKLRDILKSNMN